MDSSSGVYCEFCLRFGVKMFNVNKELQLVTGDTEEKWRLLSTLGDIGGFLPDYIPKFACHSCTRSLVHLHWFKVQANKAAQLIQATKLMNFTEGGALNSFIPTRQLISVQRAVDERELTSLANVVKDEPEELNGGFQENTLTTGVLVQDTNMDLPGLALRPALCTICGLRFERPDYLVVHMRIHADEKPFQCRFCEKTFPNANDLSTHEKSHTTQKSHYCPVCNKGFNRPFNLKVHMRVHTEDRPYKCTECPKSYKRNNDLKTHIRRHTGERSICDICGESFLLQHRLSHHKKTVHNIIVVTKKGNGARATKFKT